MEADNRHAILVTGAGGFIGARLCERLAKDSVDVIAVSRTARSDRAMEVVDLSVATVPESLLRRARAVVHCAGRAHISDDGSSDRADRLHYRHNTLATEKLAAAAADAGVQRFVFLSTIGVLGKSNSRPFTEESIPGPAGSYARSKYEAELRLAEIAQLTGMETVIIRPPLVYGPGAPGNFARLLAAVDKGLPLPFGAVQNARSILALDNLVDFIVTCLDHPAARNELFLVADGEDVSTPELLRRTGAALGKRARLVPVSPVLLRWGLTLMGKQDVATSLIDSLRIDSGKAQSLLGWHAPMSVDEGLRQVVDAKIAAETLRN